MEPKKAVSIADADPLIHRTIVTPAGWGSSSGMRIGRITSGAVALQHISCPHAHSMPEHCPSRLRFACHSSQGAIGFAALCRGLIHSRMYSHP
jgi:hypothetical protein